MRWYLLNVYVHIVTTVFWIGYVLFWTIMAGALSQQFDRSAAYRFLHLINQASWPPDRLPVPYRMKFPSLGWVAFGVLMLTGMFLLPYQGLTLQQIFAGGSEKALSLVVKLLLVLAVPIFQGLLCLRPSPQVIYLNMGLALGVVVLSVLLVH